MGGRGEVLMSLWFILAGCIAPSPSVPEADDPVPLDLQAPPRPVRTGPVLRARPLVKGTTNLVVATGFAPGASAHLLTSGTRGARDCPPAVAPTCLDLAAPWRVAASAVADAQGIVRFPLELPDGLPVSELELQAVADEGAQLAMTGGLWTDVVDPTWCSAIAPPNSQPARVLHESAQLPQDPLGLLPGLGTYGVGSHTLPSAALYAELEDLLGQPLPPVDFATEKVVVGWQYVSSTCGLSLDDATWAPNPLGEPTAFFSVRDESANCCVVCDAIGELFVVVAVPSTGTARGCFDTVGGCTLSDTADTGWCGVP